MGFLSSGYCSVTTFLNMVVKVTPKPRTAWGSSGIGFLLGAAGGGHFRSGDGCAAWGVFEALSWERWHRVSGSYSGEHLVGAAGAFFIVVRALILFGPRA